MFTPERFSIRSQREGRVHRLTPLGELDIASAPVLRAEFDALVGDDSAEKIVVDLTQLSFIDSTGLALLLLMADESKEHDRLRIVNGSPAVDRLFDLTGVRNSLPIVGGEDDPLAPLRARRTG